MKQKKNESGITLIALVITIIVLIILAMITIATLTGENGLLSKAEEARLANDKGEIQDRVQTEVLGSIGEDGKIDWDDLEDNIRENIKPKNGEIDYLDSSDKSKGIKFVVEKNRRDYNVKIEGNGKVTVEDGNETTGGGTEPSVEPSVETVPVDPNQPPTDTNKKIVNLQNEAGIEEWTPYYDDGTNKYIISWDFIPKTSVSDEIQSNKNSNGTEVEWDTKNITGEAQQVVSSSFWRKYDYVTPSTQENGIVCEKLLHESYWTRFYNNSYGEAAIGSPTLEMFEKAYNARYGTEEKVGRKWLFFAGEGDGYSMGQINGGCLIHTEDKSFFINSTYLLASPLNGADISNGLYRCYNLVGVDSDGSPGGCIAEGNLRPVIKLKENIGIRDNGTNLELYDTTTGKTVK